MTKTYVVHATVTVPVHGQLTVKARSKAEAVRKAMKTAKGFTDGGDWETELWQNGEWTKDIRWDSAESLTLTDTLEDEVPANG